MPKLKTHSGTKDRVKVTKNGKLMRRHDGGTHFLQKKSAARKRRFAGLEPIAKGFVKTTKNRLGVK
jgi:large subunit ribosomal protein L35